MASKNRRKQLAPCLSVLGTGSDVGKSIIVTALCRYFANKGIRVAPYKAQNMSNNSGVTPEGLEMGRAQIVQAEAAGIPPHVDMNPVLLKPTSQTGSQVVLFGEVLQSYEASEYYKQKEHLFSSATKALDRLRETHDLVIMEGAGSCAEVNLMVHDIVNLRIAEYADASVILVADIHRGGVFGQIVGTLCCLEKHHQEQIKGFIVNRFKGDAGLFKDGIDWIEKKTGKDVYGVFPWYTHISIEAEDSVVIENTDSRSLKGQTGQKPIIAVIRLPHISNFNDFDPLFQVDAIDVCFVEKAEDLSVCHGVILPGSKNTIYDLNWLKSSGWEEKIMAYEKAGGHILGICGGYQMMGKTVHDPQHLESTEKSTRGLGLLPVETTLKAPKITTVTTFEWEGEEGVGYEIHMGHTKRFEGSPLVQIKRRNSESVSDEDGCFVDSGRIMGTYIHGCFDSVPVMKVWLESIGLGEVSVPETAGLSARDKQYDLLAEFFSEHMDMEKIENLLPEFKIG